MSDKTVPSVGLDPETQITGQTVGYARVSSPEQNLDRQTEQLTKAGAQRIFTDTVTGSTRDRPGLAAAIDYLRTGDTLVVLSMDRLARSLVDLHNIVNELTGQNVAGPTLVEWTPDLAGPVPHERMSL